MNLTEIQEVISDIQYKDWVFDVSVTGVPGLYCLQVRFTDNAIPWTGRKWYLSHRMTTSEIAQTALKAVLTAEEHEAREKFLYKGAAIFGPHLDVQALWDLMQNPTSALDPRD